MRIDSYLFTDKGGREYNEDRIGEKTFDSGSVFVVADGLGGHMFGDLAAECVVQALLQTPPDADAGDEWLSGRIGEANQRLLKLQSDRGASMRSTVAALLIGSDSAVWANVGDSRVYYLHGDELFGVTEDHSVAFKKYRAGEISRDEIGADVDQSMLLRTLGHKERYTPDLSRAPAAPEEGDGFLLCSDGVWAYLRDEEGHIDFLKADSAREWAELLLLRVMSAVDGQHDNLSLITVMLKGDEES